MTHTLIKPHHLGRSAYVYLRQSSPGQVRRNREGRQRHEAIVTGKAGLVAARELSRLIRDNQDWSHLVRLCRFENVLLADEHRLYDPGDPQDRMVLGIQGAFNEFELSM